VAYEERNAWASLVVGVVGMAVYAFVVLGEAGGRPVSEIDWAPIMLITIGAAIVGAIVLSIVWGILAGLRDPESAGRSDERDRDIARMGDRVGQSFLVVSGLGALVLCAFEADWFWIANTVFVGFALSAVVGGIARVVAYRRGLV
jgi:hypothetical protein